MQRVLKSLYQVDGNLIGFAQLVQVDTLGQRQLRNF